MRSLFAYIFFTALGFAILILADWLAGIHLHQAIYILTHSFAIKTPIEYVLIPAAICVPLLPPLVGYLTKKLKEQNRSEE